ncbi:hypothetical protein DPEC_G00295200 [Dallia pectoralis]|uniref:Uncharacterized protein n=1 Tax=Dallia pectoralis TaxID=75939 RepID=A0ACC2FIV8_DALPE|nr:hypothetical protein DPEC_G00295200 [Dallia pectoralis]
MATFDVRDFLDNPTWEGFENCRRVDLEALAAQFGVSVPRGFVKAEVRALVLAALLEQQVLDLAQPMVEEEVGTPGAPDSPPEVEYKAPATLPRFDPISPAVHLQLEAEERAQIRKEEQQLKLEMRKLELEAERDIQTRQMDFELRKLELEAERARLAAAPATPTGGFVKAEVRALVLAALLEQQVLDLAQPMVEEEVGTPGAPDSPPEVEYKARPPCLGLIPSLLLYIYSWRQKRGLKSEKRSNS